MRWDSNGVLLADDPAPPNTAEKGPSHAAVTLAEAARILKLPADKAAEVLTAESVARHVAFDREGVEAIAKLRGRR